MKPFKFKMNKYPRIVLGLFVAAILFILGKGEGSENLGIATVAVVTLTDAEKAGFSEHEQKVILAVKKLTEELKTQVSNGSISKENLAALVSGVKWELGDSAKTLKEQLDNLNELARKQGTTLQELGLKMNGIDSGNKGIAKVLEENKEKIQECFTNGSGTVQFMITANNKGEFVARPYDPQKAAGPHATIDAVGDGGNVASIAQSLDASVILRLGQGSPIISQYRNTPWVFDLCNLVNVGTAFPFAIWYEEQAKDGASSTVAEGGTKPKVQYKYTLKSSPYKKEAVMLGFTDEFQLDFAQLQSDALGKGRVDLINRINTAILTDLTSNATAYNTSTEFKQGTPIPDANDFDVLAAMAAQSDNATFGSGANAAVMSTFKKYRMGVLKDQQYKYLNRPEVLDSLVFVGNPAQDTDNVMVGDFKQYNILLRGGMIIKIGYNGTDFAENRFSVVLEQFYFNYISTIRKVAIVKGPDFATVKTAIGS